MRSSTIYSKGIQHFLSSKYDLLVMKRYMFWYTFFWIISWHFGEYIIMLFKFPCISGCVWDSSYDASSGVQFSQCSDWEMCQWLRCGLSGMLLPPASMVQPAPTFDILLGPSTDSHHSLSLSPIHSSPISLSLKSRHWSVNIRIR